MIIIGKQIHDLRKKRNMTQEALAAEMGVSVGAVSKWETGCSMPDVMMLCNLADYFEVSVDELLGRKKKEGYLVCDDAVIVRNAVRAILEGRRYNCRVVENGKQLFEEFQEEIPAGVFLDVHLRDGEDGLEILKKIKEEYRAVKVTIVTADNSEETKRRAFEYGADYLIHKPFSGCHVFDALKVMSGEAQSAADSAETPQ